MLLTVTEVALVLKFPFKVELFAAKDLVGTKLIGNPNPYAVITCGNENRFRFVRLVSPFLHLNFSLQEMVEPEHKFASVLGRGLENKCIFFYTFKIFLLWGRGFFPAGVIYFNLYFGYVFGLSFWNLGSMENGT